MNKLSEEQLKKSVKELKNLREQNAAEKRGTLTKELRMQEKKSEGNVVMQQPIVQIKLKRKLTNLQEDMKLKLEPLKMPIKMNLRSFKIK